MPDPERTCQICKKVPPRRDDILCPDCSHAYRILSEMLDYYPDLKTDDIDRIKEVYEWRTNQQNAKSKIRA